MPPQTTSPVTIEQIARRAGVTNVTVSNVLNRRNKEVRPSAIKRAERIRKIAAEMGYRPNAASRAMRSGQFGTVCLLVNQESRRRFLPTGLLSGIEQALAKRGMLLNLTQLPGEAALDAGEMPTVISQMAVDGFLVDYIGERSDRVARLLDELNAPVVWVNDDRAESCVRPDDREAGQRAAHIFAGLGHQRLAYVGPDATEHYSTTDRREGFAAGARQREVHYEELSVSGREPHDAVQGVIEFLSREDRPTAILTANEINAGRVMFAAARLGLDIPNDLSLITVGESLVNSAGLPIHTLRIPFGAVGRRAIDTLLDAPAGKRPSLAIPYQHLDEGVSLAKPGGAA